MTSKPGPTDRCKRCGQELVGWEHGLCATCKSEDGPDVYDLAAQAIKSQH